MERVRSIGPVSLHAYTRVQFKRYTVDPILSTPHPAAAVSLLLTDSALQSPIQYPLGSMAHLHVCGEGGSP